MNVLVTGGAGFIGSALVAKLLENQNQVTIFDDFSNSSKEKISPLVGKGAKLVTGDITDYDTLERTLAGHDTLVHLAAKIDVQESMLKPELYHKVNVDGTKNLLEACIKKGVKNIVAASSAAVYGIPKTLPIAEGSQVLPLSPYGKTKVEMENLLKEYSQKSDLNCISLRFFNVYGEGQTDAYAGVITKFLQKIKEEKPLVIFGDGKNTRDFVFIDDVIESVLSALKNIEGKKGSVYNIGTGVYCTINELAELMLLISKKDLKIRHEPPIQGDIIHSQTSIDLVQKELGFNPKVELRKGLEKLFQS
jgi:UDP-glucose 4-epimerase